MFLSYSVSSTVNPVILEDSSHFSTSKADVHLHYLCCFCFVGNGCAMCCFHPGKKMNQKTQQTLLTARQHLRCCTPCSLWQQQTDGACHALMHLQISSSSCCKMSLLRDALCDWGFTASPLTAACWGLSCCFWAACCWCWYECWLPLAWAGAGQGAEADHPAVWRQGVWEHSSQLGSDYVLGDLPATPHEASSFPGFLQNLARAES